MRRDDPLAFLRRTLPHQWGAVIFALGLWIALPMIAMLLFVNLVLGVVARVASQMNIFAIGFPITLGVGLIGLTLTHWGPSWLQGRARTARWPKRPHAMPG